MTDKTIKALKYLCKCLQVFRRFFLQNKAGEGADVTFCDGVFCNWISSVADGGKTDNR